MRYLPAAPAIVVALSLSFGGGQISSATRPQRVDRPTITLDEVLRRVAQYVVTFGAQATMFVGTETYVQRGAAGGGGGAGRALEDPRFGGDSFGRTYSPRKLVSEFAIVKAVDADDWIGYRDVVEVDGKAVTDGRDRLLRVLTSTAVDVAQLKRIADESARYNIGPVIRNINVPTTALFFFLPSTIGCFTFEHKGVKVVEGVEILELAFRETARPTLVRTQTGRDVPAEGRVWVRRSDGIVVRTRVEFRNFAQGVTATAVPDLKPPANLPTESPQISLEQVSGQAQIDVTYRLDPRLGVWLPARMTELYEGVMPAAAGPSLAGRATAVAEYSGFRRFETSVKLVVPK